MLAEFRRQRSTAIWATLSSARSTGAVATFAIVAGGAGAGLSNGVVLVLGLANVLADGVSMVAGNYLKARSDLQLLERFRRMKEMHIEQIPQGEGEEIRQIYLVKGFQR